MSNGNYNKAPIDSFSNECYQESTVSIYKGTQNSPYVIVILYDFTHYKNRSLCLEEIFFFFFFFLAVPLACGSSQARDQIHTTAVT